MDERFIKDLDFEYKQYLEIMRPQLGQLKDRQTISLCNAWIQRLSNCEENEKVFRNKYLLSLCYQLAKGILEEPFLREPTDNKLINITVPTFSDVTSSEVECLVIDSEADTKVLFNTNLTESDTQIMSQDAGDFESRGGRTYNTSRTSLNDNGIPSHFQSILCYQCPEIHTKCSFYTKMTDGYEYRTNNIIARLREIKNQNKIMHIKLQELKKSSDGEHCDEERVVKVNNATNTFLSVDGSKTELNSMKYQLKEMQKVRNALIDKIQDMQETIDHFHESKFTEIEAIQSKHKLELINVQSSIRNELREEYDNRLDELIKEHETRVKELEYNNLNAIQELTGTKDAIIADKDNAIQLKDAEIAQLSNQIRDSKENLQSVLDRLLDKTHDEPDCHKVRNEVLERRLQKLEKSKNKCLKAFEKKLATIRRENYLTDCSLQLQLARGRAQVLHDVTRDNQAELKRVLDKLEGKYNDIVANMQATAIQRRIQDQMAVDSILQAASGIQNDSFNYFASGNLSHQKDKYDNEVSSLFRGNKTFRNIIVGANKSFGDRNEYCVEAEMSALFDKSCVPQRDVSDNVRK